MNILNVYASFKVFGKKCEIFPPVGVHKEVLKYKCDFIFGICNFGKLESIFMYNGHKPFCNENLVVYLFLRIRL